MQVRSLGRFHLPFQYMATGTTNLISLCFMPFDIVVPIGIMMTVNY